MLQSQPHPASLHTAQPAEGLLMHTFFLYFTSFIDNNCAVSYRAAHQPSRSSPLIEDPPFSTNLACLSATSPLLPRGNSHQWAPLQHQLLPFQSTRQELRPKGQMHKTKPKMLSGCTARTDLHEAPSSLKRGFAISFLHMPRSRVSKGKSSLLSKARLTHPPVLVFHGYHLR